MDTIISSRKPAYSASLLVALILTIGTILARPLEVQIEDPEDIWDQKLFPENAESSENIDLSEGPDPSETPSTSSQPKFPVHPTLEPTLEDLYEPTPEPTEEAITFPIVVTEADIIAMCKMVYGECRGEPIDRWAACVWCVLNRVDDPRFPDTISAVITQEYQFTGYKTYHPVKSEIRWLVEDVLTRWGREHAGETDVGRVLPKDYCWFRGNGKENIFRNAYLSPYTIWDWSLPNPYE